MVVTFNTIYFNATSNFCASSLKGRVYWLVGIYNICANSQYCHVLDFRIYKMARRKSVTNACSRTQQSCVANAGVRHLKDNSMQTSLILILVFSLSFAALLYYVFIVKRQLDLGGRGVAGMIVILVIITPIILMVIFYQSGAEQRLKKYGFNPHPDFTGSVGIVTGLGENPIWLFSANTKTEFIVEFYKKTDNHDGWVLISENNSRLVFVKKDKKMSIIISNENVLFTLFPE